MVRWALRIIAQRDAAFEDKIREHHPDFAFRNRLSTGQNAGPDESRIIRFELMGMRNVTARLHAVPSGDFIRGCVLPCDLPTRPDTEYIISFTAPGRASVATVLPYNWPEDRLLRPGLWLDFVTLGQEIYACRKEYEASEIGESDVSPCVRNQPRIPDSATKSGHCKMQFDVLPTGWTDNVRALSCSDPIFRRESVQAVKFWYYKPETRGGQAVKSIGVENKMIFQILNDDGELVGEDGRVEP